MGLHRGYIHKSYRAPKPLNPKTPKPPNPPNLKTIKTPKTTKTSKNSEAQTLNPKTQLDSALAQDGSEDGPVGLREAHRVFRDLGI